MMLVLTQTSAIHRQRKIRLHIYDDVGVAALNIKGKEGEGGGRGGGDGLHRDLNFRSLAYEPGVLIIRPRGYLRNGT